MNKTLFKVSKKNFSFNSPSIIPSAFSSQYYNNMRVISTPEFPVPYYQRISRHPSAADQRSINMCNLTNLDECSIIQAKQELAKTSEGLQSIEFIESHYDSKNYQIFLDSIESQAEVYSDDLVNFIDIAQEENLKIINKIDLADCLL